MANPLILSTDFSAMAAAKGKGCHTMIHMSRLDDSIEVFLGGVGTTAFSNEPGGPLKSVEEMLESSLVAAEWVSNKFFGSDKRAGDITINFKTIQNSDTRSTAVIIGERQGSLFPATIVNMLYFEVELPELGIVAFNKDPMVLKSRSVNLSADFIRDDVRVQRDPEGLPGWMKEIVETGSFKGIEAVGKHALNEPVALYDKDNPDEKVGEMTRAVVNVVPHYGLEVRVLDSSVDGDQFFMVVEIENVSDRDREVQWFADHLNNLEVTSKNRGSVKLASRDSRDENSTRFKLSARHRDPKRELRPSDAILIGAFSVGDTIDGFASTYARLVSDG